MTTTPRRAKGTKSLKTDTSRPQAGGGMFVGTRIVLRKTLWPDCRVPIRNGNAFAKPRLASSTRRNLIWIDDREIEIVAQFELEPGAQFDVLVDPIDAWVAKFTTPWDCPRALTWACTWVAQFEVGASVDLP